MDSDEQDLKPTLLTRVAGLLDQLVFTPEARREEKWRTTEQIANELGLFHADEIDSLDQILRQEEDRCLDRLANNLCSEAVIRRAKYPDRTTALPLWGSVKHHGRPWPGHRPDRSDPPDDIPPSLRVPDTSPHVFLSHTRQDMLLALRLAEAFAAMQIGTWRFETHIEQRIDIANCVRKAIAEAACLVAFVTRRSIASLWVLTELHTALKAGVPVVLVIDTDDPLLLKLFESVRFLHPNGMFDQSVEYDQAVICPLTWDYARHESKARAARYPSQVRDFLATLPSYLGISLLGTTQRIWQPALAFPKPPAAWSGIIKFVELEELSTRIEARKAKTAEDSKSGVTSLQ
jgi:hypothetical protein